MSPNLHHLIIDIFVRAHANKRLPTVIYQYFNSHILLSSSTLISPVVASIARSLRPFSMYSARLFVFSFPLRFPFSGVKPPLSSVYLQCSCYSNFLFGFSQTDYPIIESPTRSTTLPSQSSRISTTFI